MFEWYMSSNKRRRDIPEQAEMRISVSEVIKQNTRKKRWIEAEKQQDSDYSHLSLGASRSGDGCIRWLKIHIE